ncbi:unnamed protein product [Cladocopium goreaui]|uniref:GTPase HflX n=1 Tax=Cladocopium goreaui TaxID=2562237 RepID=A0A9P1CBS9_9DINO|nr:unnamed protein product [Cladocopium goreaui]
MSWICLKDFSTAMAPRCSTPLRHVRFPLDLTSVMANDGKKAQSLKPFAIPFPAQIFKLHGDSQADLPSIRMNWMWQKNISSASRKWFAARIGTASSVVVFTLGGPGVQGKKMKEALERMKRSAEDARWDSNYWFGGLHECWQERSLADLGDWGDWGGFVDRQLSTAGVFSDGVFVTLDIAARRFTLPSGSQCYILDSVGFIKDLPLELCEVFQATIQELHEADVILHVRDMAHPAREEQRTTVQRVLMENDMDPERVMEVWNKTDLLTEKEVRQLFYQHQLQVSTPVQAVSALTGEGFEELLEKLDQKLQDLAVRVVCALSVAMINPGLATGAGQPWRCQLKVQKWCEFHKIYRRSRLPSSGPSWPRLGPCWTSLWTPARTLGIYFWK